MGMKFESFHDGDNAGCETFGGVRLVESDEGVNFAETGQSQRRPDYRYRHSDSSSWTLPQMHFGGGNSRFVPQESNQAFISSFLT